MLDVSDGKTARAFPEMLGRHLIRRKHSLGPLRPQNHAAFSARNNNNSVCYMDASE